MGKVRNPFLFISSKCKCFKYEKILVNVPKIEISEEYFGPDLNNTNR